MNIFITGASGFVGGATAKKMIALGHTVKAMSRRESSDEFLESLGAIPVRCSLSDVNAEHLNGIDVVIHSAAYVEPWGPKDAWYLSNVVGTQNMLKAAAEAGVSRFIHIGTEAALVYGQDLHGVDETYPLAPEFPLSLCGYQSSGRNAGSKCQF